MAIEFPHLCSSPRAFREKPESALRTGSSLTDNKRVRIRWIKQTAVLGPRDDVSPSEVIWNWDAYLREIGRECRFALLAISDMKRAYAYSFKILDADKGPGWHSRLEHNDDRFWYSLNGLLGATSRLSKLFWPSGSKKSPRWRPAEARCKELREFFGIADDSPLKSRVLRDSFEHFDERMDKRLDEVPYGYMLDHEMAPRKGEERWGSSNLGRRVDPDTWTLSFERDQIELKSLESSVRDLVRKMRKLNSGDLRGFVRLRSRQP